MGHLAAEERTPSLKGSEHMLQKCLVLLLILWSTLIASADEVAVQFDARALKWIKIAMPLLEKNWPLEKDDSVIEVSEEGETVYVEVTTRERTKHPEWAGGPGYMVEISRKTRRILKDHYVR